MFFNTILLSFQTPCTDSVSALINAFSLSGLTPIAWPIFVSSLRSIKIAPIAGTCITSVKSFINTSILLFSIFSNNTSTILFFMLPASIVGYLSLCHCTHAPTCLSIHSHKPCKTASSRVFPAARPVLPPARNNKYGICVFRSVDKLCPIPHFISIFDNSFKAACSFFCSQFIDLARQSRDRTSPGTKSLCFFKNHPSYFKQLNLSMNSIIQLARA
ncbi:MAG: hypothetical protein BWY26_01375 [Elusimicrobia bacterium ADurb.Bin231]|nr:MAG: hypothetical protein BWY26_01375 [Elusimicrobia bacterium ADurb.Bin231]